jgi:hypothetical protein
MKISQLQYIVAVLLCIVALNGHTQAPGRVAIGIKGGIHQMTTRLVRQPQNFSLYLEGVRGANGRQVGVWATLPIGRWLFVDTDLAYQQKGHQLYIPGTDTVVADNYYRYLSVSSRLGYMYKGAFISVGPEANVLLSKNVKPWNETPVIEWAINARLGYQYRRLRAEVFYSKGLNPYERKTWDAEKGYATLFYGNTIGVSVGIRLFEGKARK